MTVHSPQQSIDEGNLALAIAETEQAPASVRAAGNRVWLEAGKWAFSFPVMLGTFLVGAIFY
ncbi:MAG TPA: hypothetical protein VFW94_19310, partial [Candidatus Acidoferrales bacterium]|nr:hypothetical protein [Candidatus Acidoferrales bacterium]